MVAINALVTRDAVMHQLSKRKNWAAREPGVIVVFCIVFLVAVGILIAQLYKCFQRRKERREMSKQQA
jgi:cytoskeletal protein RodZ